MGRFLDKRFAGVGDKLKMGRTGRERPGDGNSPEEARIMSFQERLESPPFILLAC